jgi:hypothetical protein
MKKIYQEVYPPNSIRRQANKNFFWEKVGAYCRRCKYDECVSALQLHHLDTKEKKNKLDTLGYWLSMSRGALIEKLSETKFTILCSNCHTKLHSILRTGKTVHLNPIDTSIFKGKELFMRAAKKLDKKMAAIKKEMDDHDFCRATRIQMNQPCSKESCKGCQYDDIEEAIDEDIIQSDKEYLESIGAC